MLLHNNKAYIQLTLAIVTWISHTVRKLHPGMQKSKIPTDLRGNVRAFTIALRASKYKGRERCKCTERCNTNDNTNIDKYENTSDIE